MAKKKKQPHPCAGCIWGSMVCDRVYCPFPFCVRKPDDKGEQPPDHKTDIKKEG